MHQIALDPIGALWLNVGHGDPAGTARDVFSKFAMTATLHFPSGGPTAMATFLRDGERVIATATTSYRISAATDTTPMLSHASTPKAM